MPASPGVAVPPRPVSGAAAHPRGLRRWLVTGGPPGMPTLRERAVRSCSWLSPSRLLTQASRSETPWPATSVPRRSLMAPRGHGYSSAMPVPLTAAEPVSSAAFPAPRQSRFLVADQRAAEVHFVQPLAGQLPLRGAGALLLVADVMCGQFASVNTNPGFPREAGWGRPSHLLTLRCSRERCHFPIQSPLTAPRGQLGQRPRAHTQPEPASLAPAYPSGCGPQPGWSPAAPAPG